MAEIIKKSDIDKVLALPASAGKKMLFKSSLFPFGILEDHAVSNDAETHMAEGDLWYCLEGEVNFIYGGELVEPWFVKDKNGNENKNEQKAKEIRGGAEIVLKPGDWLWVAPGEPHRHNCEKTARLAIIKVPKT